MNQQNPIFDDNVNVSTTHPLVDLLWLAGGAVLIVVSFTILLYVCMQWLAPHIPFKYEEKLVASIDFNKGHQQDADASQTKRLAYLQQLTNDLAQAQKLNPDMPITVHWMDDDMVNAFATLGGHIFITKGLWNAMPNENALAMVIAHEIAHVKHRDPLKSAGAGVALSLISTIVFGSSDAGMSLVGSSGLITSLHFNRDMESMSDAAAIQTLYNHYGHVTGATQFFEQLLKDEHSNLPFLQTHPLTQDRITQLIAIQKAHNWPHDAKLVRQLPTAKNHN